MATTINSGYANSPKLTANIADHADVYGGRALVFDGVTDYLDCGTGLGNQLGNNYSGGLSVSMWINVNSSYSSGQKGVFFIGNFGGSYGELAITINPTNFSLYFNQNGWQKNFNYTARDTWTHICFVTDAQSESNTKFYIDGEVQSIATNVANTFPSSGDLDFSGLKTVIGNFFNGNYPFHGKITDTKVFNSALTEVQVQELYKKPENTPSAVQDNLVAWYPMCEGGKPESPQSIVYDHSEKGKLGSEFFNNTYSSGTGGWVKYGNNGLDNDNGAVKVTYVDNAFGAYLYLNTDNDFNRNTDNTALYKFTFEAKINTGTVRVTIDQSGEKSVLEITNTEFELHTMYVTGIGGGLLRPKNMSSGQIFLIKNLSFKEVLMGQNATTNFFGDENITSNVASNWTAYSGTPAGSITDGSSTGEIYITAGSDTRGAFRSVTGLTNGKTYKFSVDAYYTGTSDLIRVGIWNGFTDTFTDYVNAGSYTSLTFTYTQVSGSILIGNGIDQGNNLFIKNLSIKEVGVSSSGFETAVNEPVVPQVPLMRYNQKMLFDGVDDKVVLNPTINISQASGQGSVSAVVNISELNNTYRMIIGGTHPNLFAYFGYYSNKFKWLVDGAWNTSNIDIVVGKTYHIVGTWNNTSVKFYVNGVLDWSITDTVGLADINSIGDSTNYEEIQGIVDEVSVWNAELTSTQVQELFNDSVALDATTHSKKANLFGYWRNDGVTTWKDRKGWSYLDFVTNDYLQSASASTAFGTNPFSFSVWINHHSTIQQAIFSSAQWNNNQDWFFASIKSGSSGLLGLGTYSEWKHNFSTNLVQTNKWHLVTYVREGTGTNQSKWYLDGALVDTATDATDWKFDTNLHIGSYVTNGGFIDGQISQLAIYHNKALSAPEVSEQFSNGISSKFTTSGATHHFVMDNGTTIVDLVGGNNATNNGATYVSGDGDVQGSPDSITIREGLNSNRDGLGFYFKNPSSNVLRLNGIDEHLKLPYTKSFDMGDGSFTVCAWVKTTLGVGDTIQTILWTRDNDDSNKGFEFQIDDGSDRPRFILSDGSATECLGTNNSVESNKWHFVAVVVDKENNLAKIFLSESDGSALKCQTTTDISARGNINATPDWYIGKRKNNTSQDFMGIIDELMVYNIALTALESDGTTVEAGDTVTSGELLKNYKFSKGKHKND